jgi:hypothetical protein
LLKQTDIISFYHIQMPHWLFADKRYKHISLCAKVAYSLLLNRYQLSKLHGWINGDGEVYIIYPRIELAEVLQVGAHKAISIFKELTDAGLVWEVRRGNNKANHIYLTSWTSRIKTPKITATHRSCRNWWTTIPEVRKMHIRIMTPTAKAPTLQTIRRNPPHPDMRKMHFRIIAPNATTLMSRQMRWIRLFPDM